MNQHILTILALWLTIASTVTWAAELPVRLDESCDSIANEEVRLTDGTVEKPQRVPKRAPSSDYTYTYKGVK